MADTARTLITDSLLDLGVIADGEVPSFSEVNGGLRKLNNLIDALSIENLMVYGYTENVFNLVSNQGIYTLGTGGDFSIPRPDNITNAFIRDPSQKFDFDLYIYNQDEYAEIATKSLGTSLPQGIFINQTYPLSTVYLYPIPTTSNYKLVLWTSGVLNNLTLDQVIILPPGYKRFLTAALVIELASSYAQQPSDAVVQIAQSAKADLKTQNFSLNEMNLDPQLNGRYWFNWRTGE